jgi:hypothetical protein
VGSAVVRPRRRGPDHLDRGLSRAYAASVTDGPQRRLELTHEVEHQGLQQGIFNALVLERGYRQHGADGWATSAQSLPELDSVLFRSASTGTESAVAELGEALLQINISSGRVWLEVAAPEREPIDTALARLRERLPAPDPSSAHEVTVTFWTYSQHGPMPSWRSIAVPSWEEITENYAASTRHELGSIMTGFQPAHGGQLILWHGNAGTGKTFGLRALAWEWREWCDFHYIVDPDSFFGQHADYLMSVLLQPDYMSFNVASTHGFIAGAPIVAEGVDDAQGGEDDEQRRTKAWRVLVLEDTGELLAADARVSVGQGLSRFLNVVDGLIGQGLRVLVLVTTNEPIRKLHPAVARPGRCAANIEFVPLSAEEGNTWLATHEKDDQVTGPATIAELYARLEGLEPGETAPLVGFGD